MPGEQNKERGNLTFSQMGGEASLPESLQIGELTKRFRNQLWYVFDKSLSHCLGSDDLGEPCFINDYWQNVFNQYRIDVLNSTHSQLYLRPQKVRDWLKNIILRQESDKILALVKHCLHTESIPEKLAMEIEKCFEFSPYCIDCSSEPVCIIPTTSEEMEESVKKSLASINSSELTGAKSHFRNSSQGLNNGNYADSIRESINAVASAAQQIDPKASRDLGPALDSLERSGIIKHRALKGAFKKLYGYTSDEQGIRKPLIEQEAADVGFDEAIFMYGACVSFVDYLVSKQRQLKE